MGISDEAGRLFEEGEKYREGNGVPKDLEKAIECYEKAAGMGNVVAGLYAASLKKNLYEKTDYNTPPQGEYRFEKTDYNNPPQGEYQFADPAPAPVQPRTDSYNNPQGGEYRFKKSLLKSRAFWLGMAAVAVAAVLGIGLFVYQRSQGSGVQGVGELASSAVSVVKNYGEDTQATSQWSGSQTAWQGSGSQAIDIRSYSGGESVNSVPRPTATPTPTPRPTPTPTPTPIPTPTPAVSRETASQGRIMYCHASEYVTLRSTPSTSADALDYVLRGEAVECLDTAGEFYRARYKGKTGYVLASYFKDSPPSSSSQTSSSGNSDPYDLSNFGYRTVIIPVSEGTLVFQTSPGGSFMSSYQYWYGDSIYVNLTYRERGYTIAYQNGVYGYVDASYIRW